MGNNSTLFELQKNALNCDRVANKYKYKYFLSSSSKRLDKCGCVVDYN